MPADGVEVIYSMHNVARKAKTWQLIIRREATLDDLENYHILEEEGETIWETFLEIICCPFCGEKLFDLEDSDFKDYGCFVHYDCSEWKTKRQ